jgi:hypothetical protein
MLSNMPSERPKSITKDSNGIVKIMYSLAYPASFRQKIFWIFDLILYTIICAPWEW